MPQEIPTTFEFLFKKTNKVRHFKNEDDMILFLKMNFEKLLILRILWQCQYLKYFVDSIDNM